MPHCTRCGAEIPTGARYCPNCGAPSGAEAAPPATAHAGAPGSVTEGTAILALLLNALLPLFALPPGIGSLIAGRREGWYQLGLGIVGYVLAFLFIASFVAGIPFLNGRTFPVWIFGGFALAILGFLAGVIGWIWGIITGVQLLREANAAPAAR